MKCNKNDKDIYHKNRNGKKKRKKQIGNHNARRVDNEE